MLQNGSLFLVFNSFFLGRGKAASPDPTPSFKKILELKWTAYANVRVTTLEHTEWSPESVAKLLATDLASQRLT